MCIGNNADTDDDNDSVLDDDDAFPQDSTETLDTDSECGGVQKHSRWKCTLQYII